MNELAIKGIAVLIRQGRFSDAESLLKDLLHDEPNDEHLLALLGDVYIEQDKIDEARTIADTMLGSYPDLAAAHILKAKVLIYDDNYNEAENHIKQAIHIDASDADSYAIWASVLLTKKQYELAVEKADLALQLEPENILGLNIRSTALLKLNRKEESYITIEGALREEPNNPFTHANYGWNLLEKGDNKAALEHFKEALKNNPNLEYAQSGMAEAIKADNIIYRLFLNYFFRMQNLTGKYQWGVLIGIFIGMKVLRGIASSSDTLRPFLIPLIVLLYIFIFSTWIVYPISNLFLRFHKYGKYLLNKKEILSSNLVGISVLISVAGAITYFATDTIGYLAICAFGFGMLPGLGTMFNPSKSKYMLIIYTAIMACVGAAGIVETFSTDDIFNSFSTVFIIGFTVFQWLANFITIKESNY